MVRTAITPQLREQLVQYFRSGEHGERHVQLLGLEAEHFMVTEDGQPMGYQATHDHIGARNVLDMLTISFPERVHSKAGDLLEIHGTGGSVSLEPASQLELSLAPYAHVADVERGYAAFRRLIDPYLAQHGFRLDTSGYHPSCKAAELEAIPKDRYLFMSSYFAKIHSNGELMMRATASTQVSIDYQSEEDAVRKMRVGSALAPILAAIADNTRVFEGRRNHRPIRRFSLWREVDPRRCGTIPGLFRTGFGFNAYADWILSASPIFQDSSVNEVKHATSLVWPDTRLSRHVELRACDCMPADCIIGLVALVKGLFYSEGSLQAIEEALGVQRNRWHLKTDDVDEAIQNIERWGQAGCCYGKELDSWTRMLFSLARVALDDRERPYLDPLEAFAAEKTWWDAG